MLTYYVNQWQSLTLLNSWAYLSGSGNWIPPQYCVIGNIVYLRGVIFKSTTPSQGEYMASLPVGARPSQNHIFPSSSNVSTNTPGRIDILTGGEVTFITGIKDYVSLCGIHFFTN